MDLLLISGSRVKLATPWNLGAFSCTRVLEMYYNYFMFLMIFEITGYFKIIKTISTYNTFQNSDPERGSCEPRRAVLEGIINTDCFKDFEISGYFKNHLTT